MATTTNFGWTTPDDTALVKDGASAIRTLGSSIDTSMAQLKGGTTGQVLSKTSNTDMNFTWVTQDDANAIQNTIVDAKGDLIAATANDIPARLAVGTNNQTLYADSTSATGLSWGAGSKSTLTTTGDILYASGANTLARLGIGSTGQVLNVASGVPAWTTISTGGMTLLSTTTLSSTTTTISSISGSYTNLEIHIYGVTMSADNYLYMRFNSDASANRYFTAGGDQGTAQTFNSDKMQLTTFSDAVTSKGIIRMTIPFYADTTIWKLVQRCALMQDDTNNNNLTFSDRINAYNQTGAITSITILTDGSASFSAGTVKIYGVK